MKTKILTCGVYDYFHYGHLRAFYQAKAIDVNPYLIVAVQESEYIKRFKPDAEVFYSTEVRCELIRALKCVDEVITYCDVSQLIETVDFDIFAVGEDQRHDGFSRAIQYCGSNGKKVVRLHRTPNISSRAIKHILLNNDNIISSDARGNDSDNTTQ